MKILLAVDGSKFTKRMLGYIAAHEEFVASDSDFTALCVQPPLPSRAARVLDKSLVEGYHADEAKKVLDPITQFAKRHRWSLKAQALVGQPAEVIARTADRGGFDLVVMGSHGHGALTNMVLGSVTSGVLARSRVPLLIVR